jgi:SRSO17 transposase
VQGSGRAEADPGPRTAGKGAKGHRHYDWAFIRLDEQAGDCSHHIAQRGLLVRRNPKTRELAFYHCWTPRPALLATLVRVAGQRWRIEECFQTGKGLVGLDQQARARACHYRRQAAQ